MTLFFLTNSTPGPQGQINDQRALPHQPYYFYLITCLSHFMGPWPFFIVQERKFAYIPASNMAMK